MDRATRSLTLVLALLLTACAQHPYHAKLANFSGSCADSVDQLLPTSLVPQVEDKKAKPPAYLEFADIAQCLHSPSGNTAVALYELKDTSTAYQVDVSVQLSTGGTFAATVELLDADRQPVQIYSFDKFVRRGGEYSLTVFPRPNDHEGRYLLVMPDVAFNGKSDTQTQAVSAPVPVAAATGVMAFIPNGHEARTVRPLLEGGKLLVALRNTSNTSL